MIRLDIQVGLTVDVLTSVEDSRFGTSVVQDKMGHIKEDYHPEVQFPKS